MGQWLVSQFKEVSLKWLGGSCVNANGEQPSRRATKLYTFLVLTFTFYLNDSSILVPKGQNTY